MVPPKNSKEAPQAGLYEARPVDADGFLQKVEKKAYELYKKRGLEHGFDWDDWFEAEKIMEAEITAVDRDCIRSQSFFEATHRPDPSPS